jgi:hypothetical protein
MSATLLNRDALASMLVTRGTVTVENRTTGDAAIRIAALILVRHAVNGTVERERYFELNIGPEEGQDFDLPPSATDAIEAVEVLLRLVDGEGTISDAYVASEAAGDPPLYWEAGVRAHDGFVTDGEVVPPDLPHLSVYVRHMGKWE